MGVKNLSQLFKESSMAIQQDMSLTDLKNRTIALDAFVQLFQFLTSIRDSAGNYMTDNDDQVTSHLIGMVTRNCALLQEGITPVYVFDGESHPMKQRERANRREKMRIAEEEYEKAVKEGNMVMAKKLKQRVVHLTPAMLDDAKKLLEVMNIPWLQAAGEGEAQCAQLAKEGSVWAAGSQDYDTLMFGAPRMLRNLTLTGKRTIRGRVIETVPQQILLDDVLMGLAISREQLIDMGILLGTDFNPDGFTKIGPKTAYSMIKKYDTLEKVAQHSDRVSLDDLDYEEIRSIFLEPNVHLNMEVKPTKLFQLDSVLGFLESKGFTDPRYLNIVKKTHRVMRENKSQTSLNKWFK